MYAAQQAPASSANPTPAQVRSPGCRPSSSTPRPASPTQIRSRGPPRAEHRQGQRADELEGDRQADRDPGEGLVDRPVHQPEGQPEGDHDQPVLAGAAAQRRPRDRQQHDRAGGQPEPDDRGRRDLVEQRLRDAGAELDRQDPERAPARRARAARCAPMSPAPPPGQPIDVRHRADEDASMSGTVLLVGTRKGLWIGTSDEAREDWKFTGPHHNMEEVYSCMVDTRSDPVRLFAGASSSWLGPQVRWSDDLGETWQETPGGAIRFPEGTDASVERVWQLVPGLEDGTVWAGTEPGAVWRSTDRGATFAPRAAALGPPAPQGVGRGVRRAGVPHDPAAPRATRTRSRSPSPRAGSTRPTTAAPRGSRATRASGPSSCPRASSTPSSASACTR